MRSKNKEATLIGFRVLVDRRGVIQTEVTELPEEFIDGLFLEEGYAQDIRTILGTVKQKIATLHKDIEQRLVTSGN